MSLDLSNLEPTEDEFLDRVLKYVLATGAATIDSGISLVGMAVNDMLRKIIASETDRVKDFLKHFFKEYKLEVQEFAKRLDELETWQIEIIRSGVTGSKDLPNSESTPHLARLVYQSINQDSSGSDRFIYSIKLLSTLSRGDIDTLIYFSLYNSELSISEIDELTSTIASLDLEHRESQMFATYTTNLMSKGLLMPDDPKMKSKGMVELIEYTNDLYTGKIQFKPTPIGLYISYCLSNDLQNIDNDRIKDRVNTFIAG